MKINKYRATHYKTKKGRVETPGKSQAEIKIGGSLRQVQSYSLGFAVCLFVCFLFFFFLRGFTKLSLKLRRPS